MTSLAHATLVEHQIMEHIKDALRLTLEGRVGPTAQGRKLESVRFMADSFERHFQRLICLEEEGGYILAECDREPHLADLVVSLRDEHAEFRQELDQTLKAIHSLGEGGALGEGEAGQFNGQHFDSLCQALRNLLDRIDAHDAKEVELLEQVLLEK